MAEFGMGEGDGNKAILETCAAEDIDKIGKMTKDHLRSFAKKKFGFNLDCSSHLAIIRGDLTKRVQVALGHIAADPKVDEEQRVAIERVIPRWLLHPVNGRVNAATPTLLARGDMIPCTKDGTATGGPIALEVRTKRKGRPTDELNRLAQDLERQTV